MFKIFAESDLKKLWRPKEDSDGEDNGQVVIAGGSRLFHGAPIFSLIAASRLVDMVFFSSPDPGVGRVAEQIKSKLMSFIWVPWPEIEAYVTKSEAVLIGPGFMRYSRENKPQTTEGKLKLDGAGRLTYDITKNLLEKYPDKKWVIDGGSLQVMESDWIPKGAILTPNKKEYELLFKSRFSLDNFQSIAKYHGCVIVYKAPTAYVTDGETTYKIKGGNAGLTKGGTGDTLAGLIVGLAAKNQALLAAAAGIFLLKKTAEFLEVKVGYNFNADDLAESVFQTWKTLVAD